MSNDSTATAPLVSVIVPTHERPELLKETMRSILDQTMEDLELIVVSNGFHQPTREMITGFDNPRVRFFEQEDSGSPASPRNHGIHEAGGELIAFCDDDDLWLPEKLAKQVALLESRPELGWCFCGYSPLEHETGSIGQPFIPEIKPAPDLASQLIQFNCVPSPCVLVRKDVLHHTGYFDESTELAAVEDVELWIRLANHAQAIAIPESLALCRMHSGRISAEQNIHRTLMRRIHLFATVVRHDPETLAAPARLALKKDCVPLITQLLVLGERRKVKEVLKTLRLHFDAPWAGFYMLLSCIPSMLFKVLIGMKRVFK